MINMRRSLISTERKNVLIERLQSIRNSTIDLRDSTIEMDGLLPLFIEGVANRIINLVDLALRELSR